MLRINLEQTLKWSELEDIGHWHRLFKGSLLSQRYVQGQSLNQAERHALSVQVQEWRSRLMSISRFMCCTNEPIARKANHEDEVTGRFWEDRFKSEALLDEKALATCMVYVDLTPIRSREAMTPEQSDHTSIKLRIKKALKVKQPYLPEQQPNGLLNFAGNPKQGMPDGIPLMLSDYLALVDWSGRIISDDKKGHTPEHLPNTLQCLTIDPRNWVYLTKNFEQPFKNLVGASHHVRQACERIGKNWVHGFNQCEKLFSSV